jgi:hypothetical protein
LLKPPSGCWQNSFFGGLAAIFTTLEAAGLLYIMHFAGKSPGYTSLKSSRLTSIHHLEMEHASGDTYLQNMPLIPPPLASLR